MSRTVVILGSTGSIGRQALDVIKRNPDRFDVIALAAGGGDVETLVEQTKECGARSVAVAEDAAREALKAALPEATVRTGPGAVEWAAGLGADVILNAVTGSAGLGPTLAALDAGSTLALANKESLVVGGALVLASRRRPDQIVPVDSEHSAIAQALRAGAAGEVKRLVLTASGGPFRGRSRADLASVTPDDALKHPTWNMGPIVTVNSATLMNKALEVIEAHHLFGIPLERIQVVVHPESEVHSMVEFCDGSTIAQASPPDMRLPIALGLGWPDRVPDAMPGYDWSKARTWTFEPLDEEAFPAVRLAREAIAASPLHPAVLNAANEEAVASFLEGALPFTAILDTVEAVLGDFSKEGGTGNTTTGAAGGDTPLTLEAVLGAEAWAREAAWALTGRLGTQAGHPGTQGLAET